MPSAPDICFDLATLAQDRDALLELNLEYMQWVLAGMAPVFGTPTDRLQDQALADYVAISLDKVCAAAPPRGVFYLIQADGQLAGMAGLRPLDTGPAAGPAAEIKRLYIRPAWRGQRLGQHALARLLADARAFGYRSVCLDSAPFMAAAHALYLAQGFLDCAPYAGCEVPSEFHARWRFMRLDLLAAPA
ncbi:GNAT family N-acetyltransferase [Paucibacter sp. APW11]|uniref:GNAT family N-acetyltransferase n=1 Tax=Roseateles aquae TaxID=3077235 RepID=A0ABU3P6U9_9BURK|nr:GNAT family N-acetyltransferase [Paucibacter sp. APW11]MDT8998278.1 GNAT family N-acetyltransferase [Paucibacter sp. APW11]